MSMDMSKGESQLSAGDSNDSKLSNVDSASYVSVGVLLLGWLICVACFADCFAARPKPSAAALAMPDTGSPPAAASTSNSGTAGSSAEGAAAADPSSVAVAVDVRFEIRRPVASRAAFSFLAGWTPAAIDVGQHDSCRCSKARAPPAAGWADSRAVYVRSCC